MQLEKKRLTAKLVEEVFNHLKEKGCIDKNFELIISHGEWGGIEYTLQDKVSKEWLEGSPSTVLVQAIVLSYAKNNIKKSKRNKKEGK